ncbi:cyclin-like, Cyclin PHO80-like protein [Artemisia annua]|uniref:Cyclin n=1 Tax=Artemisia annua TaxID=35608 RepID=A0A2U1NTK0_ARTAN|nr:cyclin-like, Cyclin PHO80-like protein [Artemisia annua]
MADHLMPSLINLLSSLLQRVAESNDLNCPLNTQKLSVFNGLIRPNISVQSYLERIFRYANCSPSCYVVAYVYLDRFVRKQPYLLINSFNVHRLLVTSVLTSVKFMDDIYYNNAYYARIGGISTAEMNVLEVDFLFGLGFNLNVTPDTFRDYCMYLQTEMMMGYPPLSYTPQNPAKGIDHCLIDEEDSQSQHHNQQLVV